MPTALGHTYHTNQQFKLEICDLQTPHYLQESFLGLIVGCNKEQLLLHYIYSKVIVGFDISTVSASMMIKSHNQILQAFLYSYLSR